MGTGRKFNKKPVSRPKKAPAERRRRETTHRKRLEALGWSPAAIRQMTAKDMRAALRRPRSTPTAARPQG